MDIGISGCFPGFDPPFPKLAKHMDGLGFESLWTGEHIIDLAIQDKDELLSGYEAAGVNRLIIGIDTGAYETGVLTALRIEDGSVAALAVR